MAHLSPNPHGMSKRISCRWQRVGGPRCHNKSKSPEMPNALWLHAKLRTTRHLDGASRAHKTCGTPCKLVRGTWHGFGGSDRERAARTESAKKSDSPSAQSSEALPGPSLQVRDLCPHSLQIEQRCGLFFRDGPPPLLPLLLRACSMGTLPDAGKCRGETGLPTCTSCFMRLGGLSTPEVRTRSRSLGLVST